MTALLCARVTRKKLLGLKGIGRKPRLEGKTEEGIIKYLLN